MKLLLRLIVSLGILALLLVFLPWAELREAVERLRPSVWLSVLIAFLAVHRLGVEKWRWLLRAGRAELEPTDAVRCYAAGLFANICLPTIVGGDVLRATLASAVTGRTEATVLGGLADRLIDLTVLGTLLLVGALLTAGLFPEPKLRVATAAVAVAGTILALLGTAALRRPLRSWPPKLRRPIGRALVALRGLRRRPRVALAAIGVSLTMQSCFVLLNVWIGHSIGIGTDAAVWFFAWPAAKLSGLLPVSLGGLGVRDATLGALLAIAGVPMASGVMASLIWQSVLIGGALVSGAVWYFLRGSLPRTVRSR